MKREKLVTAANELNTLLFDPPEIDTKADEAEIKAAVKEAAKLLEPDDELSEDALAVLQELGVWINQDEPEDAEEVDEDEEEEEAPEVREATLEEAIDAADSLKELKQLAKVSDEFKELRSGLTKYKTVEDLKGAMTTLLEAAEEEGEEAPPPPKPKAKKEKPIEETFSKPEKAKEIQEKNAVKTKKPASERKKSQILETSREVKGFKAGDNVAFEVAANHKKAAGKTLTGEISKIYICHKVNKEFVQIKHKTHGIFYKRVTAIEKAK